MEKYRIRGGNPISGEYRVKGAKNAVLPIMASSVAVSGETCLCGCPEITDVEDMADILKALGCRVKKESGCLMIHTGQMNRCEIPEELMQKIRSSVFLAGPLLARCGSAVISRPGGCAIGARPLDIHLKGFSQLGVEIREKDSRFILEGKNMTGANIVLDFPSVGATENLMTAALGAKGETVLHNCAKEPEIIDLQNYLNRCGAQIKGAGTSVIVIKGRTELHGCSYRVMGDRIEAGTFLLAAAGTGGSLRVEGIDPLWLKSLTKVLKNSGCTVKKERNAVTLAASKRLQISGKLQTGPYPEFPTDLQPQLTAVFAGGTGQCSVEERIFENRFRYINQLRKMGADIEFSGRIAIIKGRSRLQGAKLQAEDLRGGAALVLAGLAAQGETEIENIHYIERGYCNFHRELSILGGDIDKIE